jgi:hypothetical protein
MKLRTCLFKANRGWMLVLGLIVFCVLVIAAYDRFARLRAEEREFQDEKEVQRRYVEMLKATLPPEEDSGANIGDFPPWYGAPPHSNATAAPPFPAGTSSAPRLR